MNKLEKFLGHSGYMKIKQHIKYFRDCCFLSASKHIEKNYAPIEYKVYSQKSKHVFFGYYDFQQLNLAEDKMLVHVVDKGADPKYDSAEIGYYDVMTDAYHVLAKTSAWSWQQGARLRWWPTDQKYIMFNDVENGKYVCKKVLLENGSVEKTFCKPLYDIDPFGQYGLSLNFSRLQRLRPGYGYSSITDDSVSQNDSETDGIFFVDLKLNRSRLLISLAELSRGCKDENSLQHYVNHISISPDGKKFMFFHIWTLKNSQRWKTRLCVLDVSGENLQVLENVDQVSHYDWIDNSNILVTGYQPDRKQIYSVYNLISKKKTILEYDCLDKDGHPSLMRNLNSFISDTYPKKYDIQTLFECNIFDGRYRPLMRLYSTPLMYEEQRCDLHPRVSVSERYITIDTTYSKNKRQVVLLKDWKEESNG